MSRGNIFVICAAALAVLPSVSAAGWFANGNATISAGQYTLTPNSSNKVGAVWRTPKINLAVDFDYTFTVFLGNSNSGGDGICFVFQNSASGTAALGTAGDPIGTGGTVYPAVAVEVDTFRSAVYGDPAYDHVAVDEFPANGTGTANHSGAAAVSARTDASTIKDGKTHTLRIAWSAASHSLTVYFDGTQRLAYTKDIINVLFGGNPMVYLGFTGSTGSNINLQYFKASPALVSVSKSVAPSAAVSGDTVTYTVTVENSGQTAATLTSLQDLLPSAFAYAAASASGFTSNAPAVSGQLLSWAGSWTLPQMTNATNANGTLTLNFKAIALGVNGTAFNSVTLSGSFGAAYSGPTAPVTLAVPLITVAKSVSAGTAAPGTQLTYSALYSNIGNAAAKNLFLFDSLPANVVYVPGSMRSGGAASTYVTASALTDAADSDGGTAPAGSVNFTVSNLPAGGAGIFYFKVAVQ